MSTRIEQAIEQSSRENRTVELADVTHDEWIQAFIACDDEHDESDDVVEMWGATDDGHEWRLRLVRRVDVDVDDDSLAGGNPQGLSDEELAIVRADYDVYR